MNRGRSSSGLTSDGNASTTSSDNSGPNNNVDNCSFASGGGGGTAARLGNKLGINKLKNRIKLKRIGGIKNIEFRDNFDNVSIAEETMISEEDGVVTLPLHDVTTGGGEPQGNGIADYNTDENNRDEFVADPQNKLPLSELYGDAQNTSNDSDCGYRELVSSESNDNDMVMNVPTDESIDISERDPHQEVFKNEKSSLQTLPAIESSDEATLPAELSDIRYLEQEVQPDLNMPAVKLTATSVPSFTILDASMDDSGMDVYENEDEHNGNDDNDNDVDAIDYIGNKMISPNSHVQQTHLDRKQPQSLAPHENQPKHFNFDVSADSIVAGGDLVLDDVNNDFRTVGDNNSMVKMQEDSQRPRRSPRETCDDVSVKQTKLNHPSSTKSSLSCMRNHTFRVSSPTSVFHQEYNVDHSCSTPLERLARDIGNTLRQWHVHQGCDWHVPLDWAEKMKDLENGREEVYEEENGTSDQVSDVDDGENDVQVTDVNMIVSDMPPVTTTCMSMDLCMSGFRNRTRTINLWMGDENAMIPSDISLQTKSESKLRPPPPPPPKSEIKLSSNLSKKSKIPSIAKKRSNERYHHGARCIRSKKIQFQTVGFSPESVGNSVTWNRRRYCIPLLLKLWDAPQFSVDEAKIDRKTSIPRSLQPGIPPSSYSLLGKSTNTVDAGDVTKSFNYDSSTSGLTQDLSSLFNIGQHITLSFDQSEISPNSQNDIDTLYNDIRFFIEYTIHEAVEARSRFLRERQRQRKQQHRQVLRKHMKLDLRQRQCESAYCDVGVDETDTLGGDFSQEDEQVVTDHHDYDDEDVNSEYDSSESDDSFVDEIENNLEFDEHEMHAEVVSSLTAMLQTALNLAASENDCRIPVFGIWGDYHGDSGGNSNRNKKNGNGAPSWISSSLEHNLLQIGDCAIDTRYKCKDGDAQMTLLSSPILSGRCMSETCQSSHQLYYVPRQVLPAHLSTLNGLANVFVTQCPSVDGSAVLSAARHCYHWAQPSKNDASVHASTSKGYLDWRNGPTVDGALSSEIEEYRDQCRKQALLILERSFSPSITKPVPIWGPNDGNPLLSLSAMVSWGVIHQHDDNSNNAPPLLQLPLKIRSSNFASTPSELLDLELALQSAALDPIGMDIIEKGDGHHEFEPREPTFLVSAEFDMDAPCTLSANTRCVLAALLRCGSLAQDVLPGHLTKRDVVTNFGKQAALQVACETTNGEDLTNTETTLRKAIGLANVGSITKRLVDALDWGDLDMNLSVADFDRAISEAFQRIHSTTYPYPPPGVFALKDVNDKVHLLSKKSRPRGGSPPGRLLSILFAHMARLRTPTSMMRLWLTFVEELRTRWDHNESLPNLSFVPGLDTYDNSQLDKPHWGLQKADTRVLGHRADHAAFVNSSEPDPDRDHCIINQKLQLYNICIECKMSTEALHEKITATGRHEQNDSMDLDASTSEIDDDEFFDPDEDGVTFEKSFDSNERSSIEKLLMIQAAVTNPSHNRPGARCPVPDGMPLIKSGDQLYAPYLQRTMPMTDEEEENQKKFLGVRKSTREEDRPSITSRLKIAQRLQKPKLRSDMASFKAANTGALFEDFVRWYGNPVNPLNEEFNGETARRALEYRSKLPLDEAKTLALEEASEAIAILMSLRAFWEYTWEEAAPLPACDQEPLFNPYSTVELVLHSFETIHPALLVNQVMAVKLTNAKFILESAANPARNIRSVAHSLVTLQTLIDAALETLTSDATRGFLHLAPKSQTEDSGPMAFVSTSTITRCEDVCNAIGELELLLSRALPLLQMLPGEYGLVDTLLQCEEGRYHILRHASERRAFLRAIKRCRANDSGTPSEATPTMREYVLRNVDPSNPCQLCARLVSSFDGDQTASIFYGSLLMALTKCSRS